MDSGIKKMSMSMIYNQNSTKISNILKNIFKIFQGFCSRQNNGTQ